MNGGVLVRLSAVSAGYPGRLVLRDAHLVVREGDFIGVWGPNGAGKTTLFRVILGLLRPLEGVVEVLGCELRSARLARRIRRRIGYIPQSAEPGRLPLTVKDAVLAGRRGSSFGGRRRPSGADRRAAGEALRALGLDAYRDYDLNHLSGGLRRKAALAAALARSPRLVLMDEPTTHLDENAQEALLAEAKRLRDEQRLTFVVISHDRGILREACTRLIRVRDGRLEESPWTV